MGFTLIEFLFATLCVMLCVLISIASYQAIDARWRQRMDRQAVIQLVNNTRLSALLSHQPWRLIINKSRCLQVFQGKDLKQQWSLLRRDCELHWYGLNETLIFEPVFLRSHLAGRFEYECLTKPRGFSLCLSRFGETHDCHGIKHAK